MRKMNISHMLSVIIAYWCVVGCFVDAEETVETKFHIDGKVKLAGEIENGENWVRDVRIVMDDGQHVGIPK